MADTFFCHSCGKWHARANSIPGPSGRLLCVACSSKIVRGKNDSRARSAKASVELRRNVDSYIKHIGVPS